MRERRRSKNGAGGSCTRNQNVQEYGTPVTCRGNINTKSPSKMYQWGGLNSESIIRTFQRWGRTGLEGMGWR